MGRRFQARTHGGRWIGNTAENTFGLHVPVCPRCHSFNPHGVNEPRPDVCHRCGTPLAVCAHGRCTSRFLDPVVMRNGGYPECGKPAEGCNVARRWPMCGEHLAGDEPAEEE